MHETLAIHKAHRWSRDDPFLHGDSPRYVHFVWGASHSEKDTEPGPKRARATMDYSATKAKKRCAIAVAQYLADCVPQWSFTCKVLAAFEIPRESMSYAAVEFIACDIRRLLTSPVLRKSRKQETEFCRVVRERYEQHCKSDLMPQLIKAVQSGVLSST